VKLRIKNIVFDIGYMDGVKIRCSSLNEDMRVSSYNQILARS
jgi:hypothetical protein